MSKKILVLQAARFGDLVQSKRLLRSIARNAEAHLALDQSLAPLAGILYPDLQLHPVPFHGAGADPDQCRDVFTALRAGQFDLIYNCNFSPLTAVVCRLFEPDRVVGYRPAHDSAGGILRSGWARLAFRLSTRRQSSPLNLVDFWGHFCHEPVSADSVNPAAAGKGGGIGVAVAGREDRRSVPLEALANAIKIAFKLKNAPQIRLFGTKAEAPRARKLMRLLPPPLVEKTVDLCGKTDWRALVEEMASLDLLLTPDTGLMHLAAHLGVPCLAFFLSSALCHETGPYGPGHLIFQAAPACAPCLEFAPCHARNICQNIFLRPDFGRAAAAALSGAAPANWPEQLQLWQSGLDNLGARPVLRAGADAFADTRAKSRLIVKNYLGIAQELAEDDALLRELVPAPEWMLPPWRYC